MMGLTPVQNRCLQALAVAQQRGVMPSYKELCDTLGLASTGSVHRLLGELEKRNRIRRMFDYGGNQVARAIEVVGKVDIPAPSHADLIEMRPGELRHFIALASGILAHKTGGGRSTPALTGSALASQGGR